MTFRTWCTALSILVLGGAGCASAREEQMRVELHHTGLHTPVGVSNHNQAADERTLPALDAAAPLEAYLRYAALNNPDLEAAFYRWQAALEEVPQARALPDPQLTYTAQIESVETRVGPQENRVGLAQTFPWFGKVRAKGDRALAEADAARWGYEKAKLDLFFRVVDAYAEYYYLGRAIVITEENLELVKHFEEVARRRYQVAQATYSDVVKAQVELGKLADQVRTLHAMRPALASALNAALNRPGDAPLPWPRELVEPTQQYQLEPLHASLDTQNPELQAMSSEVEAAIHAAQSARLQYYPDVTLGLDWIETDRAMRPTPDSGKDPIMAMFSVNLPIWYESYRAAERQAEARLQAATLARQERKNSLVSTLDRAVFRYDDARRKINLFRDTLVPKAQQSLQATETAFTTATGDFLTLLDAQRILLEFQLSYERALADAVQQDAEIRTLLGVARLSEAGAATPDEGQSQVVPDEAADAEAPAADADPRSPQS